MPPTPPPAPVRLSPVLADVRHIRTEVNRLARAAAAGESGPAAEHAQALYRRVHALLRGMGIDPALVRTGPLALGDL
jgi:hypothetical protein